MSIFCKTRGIKTVLARRLPLEDLRSRKLEVGIKCTAILPTLGMPRNQNQACSSETPEQTKDSNDTGYTTLKRTLGQGAGKRNEIHHNLSRSLGE